LFAQNEHIHLDVQVIWINQVHLDEMALAHEHLG
jgi:hypothetical protein